MPRPKRYDDGIRVNVWIPKEYRKIWDDIENNSAFIRLCLDDIVGIMAWGILKKQEPEKYVRPVDSRTPEELLPDFNKSFPLDPLTKQRLNKNKEEQTWPPTPSVNPRELW